MGTESTADVVARWAQEMRLSVDNYLEFHESINDPAMKGVWSHIVQHVRPKQEIQKMNRFIAEYEFLKSYSGDNDVQVSVHKPEDVTLYKKREKLKQTLQQKRNEEALLDEEIKLARKQLKEKRHLEISLKRAVKNKEHKSKSLNLKLFETKQVLAEVSESNENISSFLNRGETSEKDKAIILIKQSIKELMNLNQENVELTSEFWRVMRQDLLSQSPPVVIQGALSFCQDLCASIDALIYTRCEPQAIADFSPVETELTHMRSELSRTQVECAKAEAIGRDYADKINTLFEDINQLLTKDELNQDIGKIKADRIRENLEYESLVAQVTYVNNLLDDMETKHDGSESDSSTLHNLSTDQKEQVKSTIQFMEACARNIHEYVAHFKNLHQLLEDLKSSQNESEGFFRENINRLAALKVHEFQNKLVQVHTWLVQISDDYYSNKIVNFPMETGSIDFKQIQHLLSTLSTWKKIKSLPDVILESNSNQAVRPCKFPESLSDQAMEDMNTKLKELKNLFQSLSHF